jgi:peptide/nickel transport system permease protein
MKINWPLYFGLSGILLLLIFSLFGPYLPFIEVFSDDQKLFRYEDGILRVPPYEPSHLNLLGSDREGRDLLSLLIIGTKPTLSFVFAVCFLRYLIAVPLGMFISNPIGSRYPRLVVQTWSKVASYIPSLFIIILIAKSPFMLFGDHRTFWMIVLVAVIEIGRVSEMISFEIDKLKSTEFVQSGLVVGNGFVGLVKRYFWPHILPQIAINFAIDLSRTIFLIGQLGIFAIFISHVVVMDRFAFQVLNTSITWPMLLSDILFDIRQAPWIPFWASAFIGFACFTFYLLSEGMRRRVQ